MKTGAKRCDICGQVQEDRIVDGATKMRAWAWMCEPCHRVVGMGFGTGRGQLWDLRTGVKLQG